MQTQLDFADTMPPGNHALRIGDQVVDASGQFDDFPGTVTDYLGRPDWPHPVIMVRYTDKRGVLVEQATYEYRVRKID